MDSYKNLLNLIESHESTLGVCKENLLAIEKFLVSHSAPKMYSECTSYLDADCIHGSRKEMHADVLQNIIEESERIKQTILLEEHLLRSLYSAKENVKNKLKNLKGIEYNVAYLKEVEGYNLIQIASKLEKSYDYIKEISSRIKKKRKNNKKPTSPPLHGNKYSI
ncbi:MULTISPECIES: hypothetical protein [Clostridium]|uniref:Uncharacterized protein n=1 Tax=Clostridium novyi B str. ATCC 27606 TaxID=1443123 RepID=A0AA40IRI7_CLONO|nr:MULTISPECIES: hypothetical protein [Clostridium]KEH96162.1 hypothetical protein Z953_p0229 [Clostridium botulinum D str. 16868]KEI08152.1 hypothetical protein Z958_p0032 [Clostridium novyi B str. NCTC 9691]KEI11491.1 hypothetical protein Z959_p0057 [Clostridium novyi B str. ATCC 27606]KLU74260.1 hypothetical protein CBC3_p0261 [Clostridium botulinum V891]MCD3202874.1 hypothetical protein [Clostridium botulinum C/D]